MDELHDKLRKADVIMLATPVYFYSMSGPVSYTHLDVYKRQAQYRPKECAEPYRPLPEQ